MGWRDPVQVASTVIVPAITGSFTGVFVYSGSPTTGNLIASMAPAPGTDPYGNPYFVGVTSYNNTAGTFVQLSGSQVVIGLIAPGPNAIITSLNSGQLSINSGGTAFGDTENTITLASKNSLAGGTAGMSVSDTGLPPSGQAVLEVYQTLFIGNRGAPPATPTGGGIMFVQAGALKYIGSSGTVTTIAPA